MKIIGCKSLTLLTIALLNLLIISSVSAWSPGKISYQAVIRNSTDQLVTNATVGMKISILQGSASGMVVYAETQTPPTNSNGLVSIEIGSGTTSDDFSFLDMGNVGCWWTATAYFTHFARFRRMFHDNSTINTNDNHKRNVMSVRCIKN